ncbi:unnamed protein product [Colias eurytheme]|nr:unnamed protein product [Colias eurytheme]
MSHYPPHGGPPPYVGYPPPPGVAYVPAPVMMPVYPPPAFPYPPAYPQPQPQPPQPDPVQVVDNVPPPPVEPEIDWVSTTTHAAESLTNRVFVTGREGWDGSPLWTIRAHHNGNLVPGKLAVVHRAAYIPFAGREIRVHDFEVLVANPNKVRWIPASNGQVPSGAITGGNTHTGEPLYIARVRHRGSITPGKVHPSHGCAYISFDGSEINYKNYEVLCEVGSYSGIRPL